MQIVNREAPTYFDMYLMAQAMEDSGVDVFSIVPIHNHSRYGVIGKVPEEFDFDQMDDRINAYLDGIVQKPSKEEIEMAKEKA